MRFLPGLICLLPLLSPLAHAELIDDVNDRGELRIALEANTPPFNYKDDGDKLTGFEVELGQLLANELDVRADFIVTDEADLLQGVESGKYDVALNHIALTPELKDRFDFSAPYGKVDSQLLAKKDEQPQPMILVQTLTEAKPKASAPVELAIPFQKGNPAFQASLASAMQRIKADGRLAALSEKWLSAQPTENPK